MRGVTVTGVTVSGELCTKRKRSLQFPILSEFQLCVVNFHRALCRSWMDCWFGWMGKPEARGSDGLQRRPGKTCLFSHIMRRRGSNPFWLVTLFALHVGATTIPKLCCLVGQLSTFPTDSRIIFQSETMKLRLCRYLPQRLFSKYMYRDEIYSLCGFCSCCSLTALPGPAWVLLDWICKELISSLYTQHVYPAGLLLEDVL